MKNKRKTEVFAIWSKVYYPPFLGGEGRGWGGGVEEWLGMKESGGRLQREYSRTSMCDHLL